MNSPDQASQASRFVWCMAGGEVSRRGYFPGRVRLRGTPIRRLPAQGGLRGSPITGPSALVYLADMAGWIQAFDAAGERVWQTRLHGSVSAAPALDPETGRVFVSTHGGITYAMHGENGSILWQRAISGSGDRRITSDLLYLGSPPSVVLSSWGGEYIILAASSGEVIRHWDAGIYPRCGAAADSSGHRFFLRAVDGQGIELLSVMESTPLRVLYRQPEGDRGARRMVVAASPVVDESRSVVYFITNLDRASRLNAWSLEANRLLWQRDFRRMAVATPAVAANGLILFAGMDGILRGLQPEDGSTVFEYSTGCDYLLAGAVCAREGGVFLGDTNGILHGLDLEGHGSGIYEAPRSIEARPAFDHQGNLLLPVSDGSVIVMPNLESS